MKSELLKITSCQHKSLEDGKEFAMFFGPCLVLGPFIFDSREAFDKFITNLEYDSGSDIPAVWADWDKQHPMLDG